MIDKESLFNNKLAVFSAKRLVMIFKIKTVKSIRSLLLPILLGGLLSACGSGSSDTTANSPTVEPPPSEPTGPSEPQTPAHPIVEFNFERQAEHRTVNQSSIQTTNFANAAGQFVVPISAQQLTGYLTISVNVEDSDGIAAVHVGFNDAALALQLLSCETNCATTFSSTITGVNPATFGGVSGEQLLQLWVDDINGNRDLVDSVSYSWQQTVVTGVSGERLNNTIDLSWNSLTNYFRYNVYVASEPNVGPDNYQSLADGQAFLALKNPNITLTGKEDIKTFYTTVTAVDGSGESAFSEPVTFFGLADAVDNAPTAADDHYSMDEDGSLSQNLLENDSDVESEVLNINTTPLTPASNGSLTINTDGTFTYQPNRDFYGRDGFIYEISDGVGKTDSAVVTITVNQTNDPPVPSFNRFNMVLETANRVSQATADTSLTVDVPGLLINDLDIDSSVLTVITEPVEPPTQGTLILNRDGSFIYTPNADASGEDSFTYQTIDANGALSEPSLVTITFNATSFPPIAANDRYQLLENEILVVDNSTDNLMSVLNNDSDEDDRETLTMVDPIVILPKNGVLSVNADGTFSYTPNAGFFGIDSFIYQVTDGQGNIAQAGVLLQVHRTNTTPTAIPDDYTLEEDTTLTVNQANGVLSNDRDADFDPITVDTEVVGQPLHGTVSISADGSFSYTPDANFTGLDTFRYQIRDDSQATAIGTVRLTVNNVNDPPTAVEDGAFTQENTPVDINVLANDSDPEGDALTITEATVSANQGSVELRSNQTLRYTPRNNFVGVAQISYSISDGNGGNAEGLVLVSVGAANQAPVATDDSYSINEDQVLRVNAASGLPLLTDNDSDADGDNISVSPNPVSNVSNGNLVLTGSGIFIYTPQDNFFGTDSFVYQISDGRGGTDTATVTITVNSVNDSPVANDDESTTAEDTTMEINVLANDVDVDGDALTITAATAQNGSVAISTSETLIYTPNTNFSGTDVINYTISDGNGGSDTARVNMLVVNQNDPPNAVNDNATTLENTPVTVDVLANDSDIDNDILEILSADVVNGSGSVIINTDQTLTYTPPQNFVGIATVNYAIGDQAGGIDSALLTINVTSSNSSPVANNDEVSINEDTTAVIDVLANDTDPENDSLSITSAQADNGSVSITSDNKLEYQPPQNFFGTATIDYSIADTSGQSDSAQVTVTVVAINDAPVANNDTITINEDTQVVIDVLSNDTDIDSTSLTVSQAQATNGNVAILPDNTLSYTPTANFSGLDTLLYTVDDGQGGQAQATVSITVLAVNDLPVAQPDTAAIDEDNKVIINVLANDSDVESTALTVVSAQAVNGSVSILADQTLEYQPLENFHGTDTINYSVSDTDSGISSSTVTVTIAPVNDAPIALNDTASTNEEVPIDINVLANDTDPDGDELTISQASATKGTVTITQGNTLIYTPEKDVIGEDVLTYIVTDPAGLSATANVTITVIESNDPPVAVDDVAETLEDTLVNINVLANDTDVDSPTLTVTEATAQNGTVLIKTDNTLDYTPKAEFSGTDIITYIVNDNELGTATAKVTVTVQAVNDAPTAQDDNATTDEDNSVTVNVLANDSDIDDEILLVSITSISEGGAVVNPDHSITYFPPTDFAGNALVTYIVTDGQGLTASAKLNITVSAVNDAPIARDDNIAIEEDSVTNIDILANDTDAEGDSLSFTIDSVENGTASVATSSAITFSPTANFNGQARIVYTVSDNNGGSDSATVNISVSPVNDAPVASNDILSVEEDSSASIAVLANDSDVDGDSLSVLSANVSNGQVAINDDQSVLYTPNKNFNGTDVINYTITDGKGGTAQSSVAVTVLAVNDTPVAQNDQVSLDEDSQVIVDVLANDSDVDTADVLRIISASSDNGAVTINGDNSTQQLSFAPTANFHGITTISYTIADTDCASPTSCAAGHTASAIVEVTVNSVNDAPSLSDVSAEVAENAVDGHSVVTLSAEDVDDDQFEYSITGGNTDGVFTINQNTGEIKVADRTFLDFETTSSYLLTVQATDSFGASGFAQATIAVTEVAENVDLVADSSFGNTNIAGLSASNAFAFDNQDSANGFVLDSSDRAIVVGSVNRTDADISISRFQANGQLDLSFGIQGMLSKDLGSFETAKAVAVDSNNNIYVAGEIFNGSMTEYFIIKFLSTGTIDTSFGTNGLVTSDFRDPSVKVADILVHSEGSILLLATSDNNFGLFKHGSNGALEFSTRINMPGEFDAPTAMAEQSDGKIVMAGYTADSANFYNYDFALARVEYTNMTLDTQFGTNGLKTLDLGNSVDDIPYDVMITTNQDIIVVGATEKSNDVFDAALVLLDSSGALQTNGIVFIDGDGDNGTGSGSSYATSIAGDSNGLYLGLQLGLTASTEDFGIAKLNSSGVLDSSFGNNGIISHDLGNSQNKMVGAKLNSSSQLVVATSVDGAHNQDSVLLRLTSSGALDTNFANAGYTVVNHTPSDDTMSQTIALQSSINSGKLVAIGSATGGNGVSDLIVARYSSNGALDTGFANSGYFRLANHAGAQLQGKAVAELTDGRLIIAGQLGDGAVMLMLDSNGRLDTSFAGSGIKTLNASHNNLLLQINAVATFGSDKILFAGYAQNVTDDSADIYLGKLNFDGSFDSSFGSSGEVLQNLGGNEGALAMAVLPDGAIIVAGGHQSASSQDTRALLAKFQSNGSLDTSGFASGAGYQTIDVDSTVADNSDMLNSVVVTSGGTIYAAGQSIGSSGNLSALVSLTSNGNFNTAFSSDGIQTVGSSLARSVTLDSNDRLMVSGVKYNATNGFDDVYVVRVIGDGSLDTLFNNGSPFLINFNNSDDVSSVLVLSNGSVLIAGDNQIDSYNTQVWYLRVYNLVQ